MKSPYRIFLLTVSLPFLFAACSLTSLIQEESRLEQVRVYLADGSVVDGKARLPDLEDKAIRIVAEGKERKHIKADNIKALAFRRENTEGRRGGSPVIFNDRVYIVAFRKDCPGQLVGYDDSRIATLRMNLLEILGDDPLLCRKLQGRELSVSDYRTICSEYNPESSREDGKFI